MSLAIAVAVDSIHTPHLTPQLNSTTQLLESIANIAATMLVDFCSHAISKYLNLFNTKT